LLEAVPSPHRSSQASAAAHEPQRGSGGGCDFVGGVQANRRAARCSFNLPRPDDLAGHAIRHAIAKIPELDPKGVEEVVLGCGQPHGSAGHNIARVAALRAGLPTSVAGVTVNRFCNSGLQAVAQAAHMVMLEGVEAIAAAASRRSP
jgi:acetyl-CoA acyltransferase